MRMVSRTSRRFSYRPAAAGSSVWGLLTAAALVVGLTLLVDTVSTSSATYDEVAYLRGGRTLVAHWRSIRNHTHGLSGHVLEAPASSDALGARPHGPSRVGR